MKNKLRQKWSFGYKLKRSVWNIVWIFFFKPTPKRLGQDWRNSLLKLFGAKITGRPLVCSSVRILEPWNLTLEHQAAIGERVDVYNYSHVFIGERSVISQDTVLCTGSHDYTKDSMPLFSKPISIGKLAWVASKTFIHPGITIGEGAVIGACSVVVKNMPEWTVCTGHPCKSIKPREYIIT